MPFSAFEIPFNRRRSLFVRNLGDRLPLNMVHAALALANDNKSLASRCGICTGRAGL
jgi:hypothetical protein